MTLEEALAEWKTLTVTKIVFKIIEHKMAALESEARGVNITDPMYGQIQAFYTGRLLGLEDVMNLEVEDDSTGSQDSNQAESSEGDNGD